MNNKLVLKVITYNVGDGPAEKKRKDLDTLKDHTGFDICGLQETSDRVQMLEKWVRDNPEYALWIGDGRLGAAKIAILYRTYLNPNLKKSHLLVGARRVGDGAGPENAPPKIANRIRFKLGGRRVNFFVAHQYATVHNRPVAAALFMVRLIALLRPRKGTILLTGDFNMTREKFVNKLIFKLMPSWSNVKGPTHGNKREIDFVAVRGGAVLEAWTVELSSDHRAVVARVRIG